MKAPILKVFLTKCKHQVFHSFCNIELLSCHFCLISQTKLDLIIFLLKLKQIFEFEESLNEIEVGKKVVLHFFDVTNWLKGLKHLDSRSRSQSPSQKSAVCVTPPFPSQTPNSS